LTRTTSPRNFAPPSISASDGSDDDDDDDVPGPHPTPVAPFDMSDTNAPLTPRLPRKLLNLETFYNPNQGDKSNIPLLTHDDDNCEDEVLSCPYKEPDAYIDIKSDDVEFCNAHLPEYDSNPQSAAQAVGVKLWLQSF
jgi:hypothetical protein